MRVLVLVLGLAALASGCASPTQTLPPPPTLPPTLVESPESPTATPVLATETSAATDTTEPTDEPTPDATDEPVAKAKPLVVEFVDLHYECVKLCNDTFKNDVFWVYRSFQVLMRVKNVSRDLTLAGGEFEDEGWAPTTWYITDGTTTRTDDYAWQWAPGHTYGWARPDLLPGAEAEWTWMAEPLKYGEWVSAVEYVDEWGNTYRQDFPKPEGGAFNYVDCGDPMEGSC